MCVSDKVNIKSGMMWIYDDPLQNPLFLLSYACSLLANKIMCGWWATYYLPITLCEPKKGDGKPSALRKLSDASPRSSEICKGSINYSLSLITHGPNPKTNEEKNALVIHKYVWILGHLRSC